MSLRITPKAMNATSELKFKYPFQCEWSKTIGTALDEETFSKFTKEKIKQCEILYDSGNPVGLFSYQAFEEDSESFQLNKFEIINSKEVSDKKYEKTLLNRVITLAKRSFSKKIIFTSSVEEFALKNFLLTNGFIQNKSSPKIFSYSVDEKTEDSSSQKRAKRKPERSSEDLAIEDRASKRNRIEKNEEKKEEKPKFEKTHFLPMKGTIYFEYIMSGKKLYEGRVFRSTCSKMRVGEKLKMFDNRARWGIICEIISVDKYKGFKEMLEEKGVLFMLPQLEEKAKKLSSAELLKEGVRIYESFPGAQSVKQNGAVAIGVRFLNKVY